MKKKTDKLNTADRARKGGMPTPGHDEIAEQARESVESAKAHRAKASIRNRMVEIGRGVLQSGRHRDNP